MGTLFHHSLQSFLQTKQIISIIKMNSIMKSTSTKKAVRTSTCKRVRIALPASPTVFVAVRTTEEILAISRANSAVVDTFSSPKKSALRMQPVRPTKSCSRSFDFSDDDSESEITVNCEESDSSICGSLTLCFDDCESEDETENSSFLSSLCFD